METHISRATAYYPDASRLEGGFLDCIGRKLCTLQDHIAGKAPYCSLAFDEHLHLPYGTLITIPKLDIILNFSLILKAVDNGGAFAGKGFSRFDICVNGHQNSLLHYVNATYTIHVWRTES